MSSPENLDRPVLDQSSETLSRAAEALAAALTDPDQIPDAPLRALITRPRGGEAGQAPVGPQFCRCRRVGQHGASRGSGDGGRLGAVEVGS